MDTIGGVSEFTTKYQCDRCGSVVNFDENAALVSQDIKHADLCASCLPFVEDFIKEGDHPRTQNQFDDEKTASVFLRGHGYIVYKQPAVWGQKGKLKSKDKK